VLYNADLAGRPVMDPWRAEGHAANSVIYLSPRHAEVRLNGAVREGPTRQLRQQDKLQESLRGGKEINIYS
jgi:hypothetical protein